MRQTNKIEFWVGLFVLIGISAFAYLLIQFTDLKLINANESYILHAQFDNIGNLKIKSPVKVGGVVVGKVSKIDLHPDTLSPVVTMEIHSKYNQFAETSSAQILTSGLIGEQYIGITPGFIFEDEQLLSNGSNIEDTKSALVLEDLIGQVLYRLGNSDDKEQSSDINDT